MEVRTMLYVIPAAGDSTRLPDKLNAVLPNGQRLCEAVRDTCGAEGHRVIFVTRDRSLHGVDCMVLAESTLGQADTVYRALNLLDVDQDERIIIQNADNVFAPEVHHDLQRWRANSVALFTVPPVEAPGPYSYAELRGSLIISCHEKTPTTRYACAGIYLFGRVKHFLDRYNSFRWKEGRERFISSLLFGMSAMLIDRDRFIHVGTSRELSELKQPEWLK